jgi:hypothetical protein
LKNRLLVIFGIASIALALVSMGGKTVESSKITVYSVHELKQIHQSMLLDTNALFLPGTRCQGCHGHDPLGNALVTLDGVDVNLFDDWQTSMMGLAGVDPLWKAKVRHEVLVNPGHSVELQSLCTSCHAPMGHFTAFLRGGNHYSLDDLATDSLGQSGVSCLGCHSIGTNGLGTQFTGQIPYDTSKVAYGPFANPLAGPMQLYTRFTPAYGPHVSEGRFCSPCHTLISNTVDLEGNPTGGSFVEQATFHEWINSAFPGEGTSCQTCHMPQIEDPVKIAVGYTALPGRTPFNIHTFSGANSFMVNLIKQNKTSLGVTASDANFDSTLAGITKQLKLNTLTAKIETPVLTGDSIFFDVTLTNKAGHKFPSGYPSRRAFVQFILTSANGDTLFSSGIPSADGDILNYNGPGEIHHDLINRPHQVQIYELIMGDVNGSITTVLERSASNLKDNRIPPRGFLTSHAVYDTCKISGEALTDPDFNKTNGAEGTGKDIIHYHIPFSQLTGRVNATVKVYYQSVPSTWLREMRNHSAPEINQFLNMYDSATKDPVLVAQDSLQEVLIPLKTSAIFQPKTLHVFPNPLNTEGKLTIQSASTILSVIAYSSSGKQIVCRLRKLDKTTWELAIEGSSGIYYLDIQTTAGRFSEKLFIQN